VAAGIPQQERNWAMAAHLLGLAGPIIAFGNIIGPLVIWLVKRDEWRFVADQAKESLNFQISMTIYIAAATVLAFLLIGLPFLVVLPVLNLVAVIVAAIRANEGKYYRYPACIRFVS
jgi:hypothetical protein